MEFIKKFAREISVFGVVLVIFLALFIYRQATFKDFKTIDKSDLTEMVADKESFVVVMGNSADNTVLGYQEILTDFATNNRSVPIYFIDTNEDEKFDSFVEKTLKTNVTYPATLVINDGEVAASKYEALQYYYLVDFINANYKAK